MKSNNNLNTNRAAKLFYFSVALFPLLQFLIFYVAVHVNSLALAFEKYDLATGSYVWNGTKNLEQFFNDLFVQAASTLRGAIWNSFIIYICSLFLGITLAQVFSYYIFKKMVCHDFFKVLLFLPSIISAIVVVLIFKLFVNDALPEYVLNITGKEIPGLFTAPFELPNPSYDVYMAKYFPTIVFYTIWVSFGTQILMFTGVMSRISESIIEYASLDGIKPMQEYIHVVMPMIFPTISTFIVIGVGNFFLEQANLYAFYGKQANLKLQTIGYYLFNMVIGDAATLSDYPYAAAVGLVFTLIAAPVTLIVKWMLEKFGPEVEY